MNDAEYQNLLDQYPDTAVCFGDDPSTAFAELALVRRIRRAAVFTGRRSADASGNFGFFASLARELDLGGCRYKDIPAEPDVATIGRMVEFLRDARPDTVIALGGGSVMDAAKAAWITYQSGAKVSDFFGSNRSGELFPGRDFDRVICFPTTSGTGSEVTLYSNIVDPELRVKKLISDPGIIPAHSFVVPRLNASMPPAVTLATGCDALAHLVEGFLNIRQDANHPAANAWALAGIRLIADHLPAATAAPNPAHRAAMAAAGTLGGMVIRYKSTGLPHLCSFSWFGRIEHGLAVAMLLPAAWRYYLDGGDDRLAARTMELSGVFPGDTPEEVIASFRAFLTRCGVPARLRDVPGITPELLALTAASAKENRMKLELAPRPVPVEESAAIIAGILARS